MLSVNRQKQVNDIKKPLEALIEKKQELKKIQEEKTSLVQKAMMLDEKKKEIEQKRSLAQQKIAHGEKLISEGKAKKQELETRKKVFKVTSETKTLVSLFPNYTANESEYTKIHNDYLSDTALGKENDPNGGIEANLQEKRIIFKSMTPVVKFLKDHKEIDTCNFEVFEDKMADLAPLLKFLKENQGQIKAINFSPSYLTTENQGKLKIEFKKYGVHAFFEKT